jgi:hypothetical protein
MVVPTLRRGRAVTETRTRPVAAIAAALLAALMLVGLPSSALARGGPPEHARGSGPPEHAQGGGAAARAASPQGEVRFASYNASLNRNAAGQLIADLSAPGAAQPGVIAETIQRVRPDIVLVNEFDHDPGDVAVDLFHDNYLAVAQHPETDPIEYPYRLGFASNTGVPSGFDLNRDGAVGGPDDAFGFGFFPGQFAFALYSKYPIVEERIRTFQEFRWVDMPGALLPSDPATEDEGDWYSDEILEVFRLSSKNHVDVPVRIGRDLVHVLASHPTPPAFDGAERRNVLRNHDEIRFWADYISPGQRSAYIYDDDGRTGGLRPGARFVIAGDLNSDPCDGDSVPGAIQQVLDHPLVQDPLPASDGAVEQSLLQGQVNLEHCNPPQYDTADFNSATVGNLRVDYLLPRKGMRVTDTGVFWPTTDSELFDRLVGTFPFPGSDHRLVHLDVALPVGGPR